MKQVLKDGLIVAVALIITGILTYYYGKHVQRYVDDVNTHYRLHAAQLTANDIPIYYVDEIPGMAGTKEKPVLCEAYYDSAMRSVILFTVNERH